MAKPSDAADERARRREAAREAAEEAVGALPDDATAEEVEAELRGFIVAASDDDDELDAEERTWRDALYGTWAEECGTACAWIA